MTNTAVLFAKLGSMITCEHDVPLHKMSRHAVIHDHVRHRRPVSAEDIRELMGIERELSAAVFSSHARRRDYERIATESEDEF